MAALTRLAGVINLINEQRWRRTRHVPGYVWTDGSRAGSLAAVRGAEYPSPYP